MNKIQERIIFLEKQIELQQKALINARSHMEAVIHAEHLRKVTNEWCELTGKNGSKFDTNL